MKHAITSVALALTLSTLIGCATSPTPSDPLLDPQNAYGTATDPLPRGATQVSVEEIKRRIAGKPFRVLKFRQLQDEATNAQSRRQARRQAMLEILRDHPKLQQFLNAPKAANAQATGDGNYRTTIQTASGPKQIVTMGEENTLSELVQGFLKFRTRPNQTRLYTKVYNRLSAADQARFTPPSNLGQFSDDQLIQQTRDIANTLGQLPAGTTIFRVPDGYVSDPNQEVGRGEGSDRSSCTESHGSNGIYANFTWPLKYYATSVKDQGSRGTCTGFAVTGATEALVSLKYARWVNLSEQRLYNQHTVSWYPTEDAFGDGAVPAEMLEKMDENNFVQPLEEVWNYNPSDSRTSNSTARTYTNSCSGYDESCSDTNHQSEVICTPLGGGVNICFNVVPSTPSGYEVTDSDVLWSTEANAVSGLTLMQSYLADKNPVVLSVQVVPSFDSPNANGFVTYVANQEADSRGNHAILATGFITNDELRAKLPKAPLGAGGGYVIIKNSWGACWADAGYAYLPYSWITDYAYRGVAVDTVR